MPGPIGKRDEERRRRNKDAVETEKVDIAELAGHDVEIPLVDESWHPIAQMFWTSLKGSGQAIFMEPSDWAVAYLVAESISRDLEEQVVGITEAGDVVRAEIPLKGASLSSYAKMFSSLMVTEGDRRRLKIELERKKAKDAAASGGGEVIPISEKRTQRFNREA